MASINLYKARVKEDQTHMQGGYKNVVLWSPTNAFLSIKIPTASAVSGDTKKITTAHTFPADEGFISWHCKKHSVTTTMETTGDEGAQSLVHKAKFVLLGDDASTLEQLENMLNDDCIFLLKDQDCANTTDYIQFGDECLAPTAKISFDGKTTAEGLKEYTVELTVKAKKFFYSAAITAKP